MKDEDVMVVYHQPIIITTILRGRKKENSCGIDARVNSAALRQPSYAAATYLHILGG